MTWKIVVGIHWEALKLWPKGMRFCSGPRETDPVNRRDLATVFEPGE